MEIWYVYSLYSYKSDIIYVGMSQDPEKRLLEHNNGKTRSTKAHIPWVKFFQEEIGERGKAREREKYYKSASGKKKLKKLLNQFPKP